MKEAARKALKGILNSLPIIFGTVLLISLMSVLLPKSFYTAVFNKNPVFDVIVGNIIGSISAGNPITSYIFGGELLDQGISLFAVTAFLISWVTVGLVQLPAESMLLGKKFAIARNLSAFVLAILAAALTVVVFGVL